MSRTVSRTAAGGVTIAEAAERLGLTIEAVRKRAQRGTLPSYKVDERWFIVLDSRRDTPRSVQDNGLDNGLDTGQDTVQDRAGDTSPIGETAEPIEATYRVTPAEIEQAVSRTSAQYMGDLRTVLAEVGKVYEGRIAATEAALAAKDETIAELRRRAEQAEGERTSARRHAEEATGEVARLRERLAASEAPSTGDTTPHAHRGAQGLWWRLRRAFGGE